MKQFFLAIGISVLAANMALAQTMAVENVYKYTMRNSDAIKEGSEVKGYYFFYISDKIDKKTNEYTLNITDNNLKTLKSIKFEDTKALSILEASFNGTDLIFLFYNDKENMFEYKVYGADGKMKFTYTRDITKKEERYLENTYLAMSDDEKDFKGLYPVPSQGFISNMPSRENKDYTYEIGYYGTDARRQWSYTPTEGAKKFLGEFLGMSEGTVFLEELRFKSMLDQKPDSYIIGLDLANGKKKFEKRTDTKLRFYPASMSKLNNGQAYIFGEYFDLGDNIFKDKSKGFGFWAIDKDGIVTLEKYNSWETDMAKYLDVSASGRVADFGFLYLHQIMQTADGNIYAVAEGFKKVASALGIASTVLNGGSGRGLSTLKLKVTDMALLKFDKEFNIKAATIYEKKANNFEMPSGYEFVSTPLIARMIKYDVGGFDYAYTQVSSDLSSFTVCYSDYVRGKDYKGATFNSITCTDGKFTTDKINTKSGATSSNVLPGKQGQVLVIDYYRKEKKIEAHFEKLN